MFSSFRNAVENLAPQPVRNSLDQGRPNEHEAIPSPIRTGRAHMSLEERLRGAVAKPTITESTSEPTLTAVPPVVAVASSPHAIPLPESRPGTPIRPSTPIHRPSTPLRRLSTSASIHLPSTPTKSTLVKQLPTPLNTEQVSTEINEANIPLPDEKEENHSTPPSPSTIDDINELQLRLRLVEQRFTDVSMSFKRIRAEKLAADAILSELTPLQGIDDANSLRDYLQNLNLKSEVFQDEVNRLQGKLVRQEERVEELRDTHRLESKSQSEQIERLKKQSEEAEALIKSSLASSSQNDTDAAKQAADITRLQTEVERVKGVAKDEEEKRIKAISLLKTVRQKLVKAEKDKEEALKEVASLKSRVDEDQEKDKSERAKLQKEIAAVHAERESAVNGLKAQFDREISTAKERFDKEATALKSQYELDAVTTKGAHAKEITGKNTKIAVLENSVNTLSSDKNALFEQLQLRQAELESSQSHIESLEGQTTELQYQLRETNEQLALLTEDLADTRREQTAMSRNPTTSAEDVSRLLADIESKHEQKLADVKKSLAIIEKERNDGDLEWSRKLRDKTQEVERTMAKLDTLIKSQDENVGTVDSLKIEVERLQLQLKIRQEEINSLTSQAEITKSSQSSAMSQATELNAKIDALERSGEEGKTREAQLRANNKTLRDELRKVQSSAALLERQRNPGVGYWTSRPDSNSTSADSRPSISSASSGSRPTSPSPNNAASQEEEQVNIEYLRNVILQFLEHKEMRPSLVKVLSIILRFTPSETRRLIAKV